MEQTWSKPGANMEQTWSKQGTNMEQTRSKHGANSERTWDKRRTNVEKTRSKHGTNVDRTGKKSLKKECAHPYPILNQFTSNNILFVILNSDSVNIKLNKMKTAKY